MGNYACKANNEYELVNKSDPIEDIRKEQIKNKAKRKYDMISNKLRWYGFEDSIDITIVFDDEYEDGFIIVFKVYIWFGKHGHLVGYFYTPYEALEEYRNMVCHIKGNEVINKDIGIKYFNYNNSFYDMEKFIDEVKTTWDNFE